MHQTKYITFLTLLLIFTCLLFVSGCDRKELVNNSSTGEIFNTENTSGYVDGTYSAVSKYYNSSGYGLKMTIDVHRGIITHVHYDEVNKQGLQRLSDPAATLEWPESDFSLGQIYTKLYTNFINKQKPEFDAISGATATVSDFKQLAESVCTNAKNNDSSVSKVNDFVQTYTAESPAVDELGFRGKMTVTFDNDTITQVTYDEIKDGLLKSSNNPYKQL
ncbi:MAG: hypothetical protein RR614_05510, partial [Eubacterium sp.]